MVNITLSMIVKNEEKYLEECLRSVEDVVDEIVIVDTGSSDNTIEIAKKYNAKIFNYEWKNDFADARNYALSKSTGKWILYLDADERLLPGSIQELKKITAGDTRIAYQCIINNIDDINNRPCLMKYIRLFPNIAGCKFEGKVHEQIIYSLQRNKIKITDSSIRIDHLGYGVSKEILASKAQRNLKLLLVDFESAYTSYTAYQLGQTYGMLDSNELAEKYFLLSLNDNSLPKEYKSTAARYIAGIYMENGRLEEALKYISISLNADKNQPLAYLIASQIYFKMNNSKGVKETCVNAYEINRRLQSGKISSFQTIYLNSETIIYHSLNYAILLNDREFFNYFYKELKNTHKNILTNNSVLALIEAFLNNKSIGKEELKKQTENVEESNLELILNMLNSYKDIATGQLCWEELYKKHSSSKSFISRYSAYLSASGELSAAETVLQNAINSQPEEPSFYFYLISLFIRKNEIQNVKNEILRMESRFTGNQHIVEKLNIIKSKLHSAGIY